MTRKLFITLIVSMFSVSVLLAGCGGYGMSQQGYQGAAVGGGVGAAAGALIDSNNRWRGGVIGGALGAVLGGALTEIGSRASYQAAAQNRPVQYTNQSGTQQIRAYPGNQQGNCQEVREEYYEHGQLVKVTKRQVCQ